MWKSKKKEERKEKWLVRAGNESEDCVRRKEGEGVGNKVVRASVADVTQIGIGAPIAPGFDLFGWIAERAKGGGGSDPEGVPAEGGALQVSAYAVREEIDG